jgi:pimeloyl-ACP methyl ester carboxylesterase
MFHQHRVAGELTPPPARVVALHCSGATGRQWRRLQERAGAMQVIAPDLYGAGSVGHWTGQHAFSLADEAERVLSLPDLAFGRFHLVGHSYGGGVALKLAPMVPDRVASLCLYEPSAFHLLEFLGPRGRAAMGEIRWVANTVANGLLSGDYQSGAARFVEYWNGDGSWAALKPELRAEMVRYLPKACLDFRALFEEDTPRAAFRELRFPVLLMAGEFAPAPTRVVAEGLAAFVPDATSERVLGAGHMGPLTHAEIVNDLILGHIAGAVSAMRQSTLADMAAA